MLFLGGDLYLKVKYQLFDHILSQKIKLTKKQKGRLNKSSIRLLFWKLMEFEAHGMHHD